jgi:hypothetical protein
VASSPRLTPDGGVAGLSKCSQSTLLYYISSLGKTRPAGVRWGLETSSINDSGLACSSVTAAAAAATAISAASAATAATAISAAAAATAATAISAATAATAAATAAAATISAAAAATATAVLSAGERLIHVESSALDFFAVQAGDGSLPFIFGGHLNEPKPFGLTTAPVFYDRNGFNRPECCERLPQVLFGNFVRQISCIDFHTDLLL